MPEDTPPAALEPTPAGLSEHDQLVKAMWEAEEAFVAARRADRGDLASRLAIENARTAMILAKSKLEMWRQAQAKATTSA